ncbi:lantibiotic immunity ABC transporter MutE/EpiE family permease subunit [Clostridiaceae bacterium M8S5]|nr:lantibiotic immunity ABC transporter MutE/EpiE family permease subunit [Clostridiaceae bacterium M8S5]
MKNYIKAENLKLKRTFIRKLIMIMPILSILVGALSPPWFEVNSLNWWYVMVLSGYIALICFLVHQKEQKKQKYIGVMSLPVDLKKIWISKILVIGKFLFISSILLAISVFVGKIVFIDDIKEPIHNINIIVGLIVIVITSLWQIPLCMYLSKRTGLFTTVVINSGVGIVLNIIMVSGSFWWICPYSWTTRLMCPILGILPNGTLAEKGDMLLGDNVIVYGLILSIMLFALLVFITSNWFSKQEVK